MIERNFKIRNIKRMIFDTGREGRLTNMLTLKCVTLKRQLNVLKHQLIIRDGGEEGGGRGRGGG